jgi:hypothetical protein
MKRSALLVLIALFTINAEPAVAASDAECRALYPYPDVPEYTGGDWIDAKNFIRHSGR